MLDGIDDGTGGSPIANEVRTAQNRPIQDEFQCRFRLAMLIRKRLLPDDLAIKIMQELDRESERKHLPTQNGRRT